MSLNFRYNQVGCMKIHAMDDKNCLREQFDNLGCWKTMALWHLKGQKMVNGCVSVCFLEFQITSKHAKFLHSVIGHT